MTYMNVTELRKGLRRSSDDKGQQGIDPNTERRKGERRAQIEETAQPSDGQRVWLTPGEKTLIEDVYLLDVEQAPGEAQADSE